MPKIWIIVSLIVLLAGAVVVFGQDDDLYIEACELDSFNAEIDAILSDYAGTRNIDSSTDGALVSAQAMVDALSVAQTDCLEAQQTARLDSLDSLLDNLYEGGYIIYVRHTHTDRSGSGDTEREGCETERNLSTRGRMEAQSIHEAYAQLELPVSLLISTELCRTLDTTELAFGEPTQITPRSELENTLADVLTIQPDTGTNTIIVAHIGTMNSNFGLPIPFDEGDSYVFLPMGNDGFELVGRISLTDWQLLTELD